MDYAIDLPLWQMSSHLFLLLLAAGLVWQLCNSLFDAECKSQLGYPDEGGQES